MGGRARGHDAAKIAASYAAARWLLDYLKAKGDGALPGARSAHAPTFALAQRTMATQDPRSCHGARSARPRLDMRMRARPRLAFSQTHGRPSIPLWPTSQRSKRSQTR